jgi:hypothetical protein
VQRRRPIRAERRCGQLLAEQEKAKGARSSGSNQYVLRSHDKTAPTLADHGINKSQQAASCRTVGVGKRQSAGRGETEDPRRRSGLLRSLAELTGSGTRDKSLQKS